jgi:hypothetical protein
MTSSRGYMASALIALAAAARVAVAGEPPPCGGFVGFERYAVNGVPTASAAADFNLDGTPDFATGSATNISVLLGTPGAGLAPPRLTEIDFSPVTLVAGDFDGDGTPDLVAAGSNSPIYFLHGNGNGTFGAPVFVGYVDYPYTLAAADLDGDGRLDIVSVVSAYPKLLAFLGHGDGTFADPVATPLDSYADSFAIGLLDGDAYPDVVVAGYQDNSLVVLRGQGDGSFGAPTILATGSPRLGVQLADFNGDGNLDIAVVTPPDSIGFLPGHGDGTFGAEVLSPAGPSPFRTILVDLDGDGLLDLAVLQNNGYSPATGGLQILLGQGDGTFRTGTTYATGAGGGSGAAADFDGDGLVDIAFASNSIAEAWLLPGQGDGTLRAAPYELFGLPASIAIAGDFNEDGRSDLASAGYASNNGFSFVNVALAEPGSRFGAAAIYPSNGFPASVVAGDFNDSGHLDLAFLMLNNGARSLDVLPGNGDGTFGAWQTTAVTLTASNSYPLVAGRFDSDAELDVVIAEVDTNNQTGSLSVLLGNGHGGFVQGPVTTLANPPSAMAAADFDGDGKLDLAVATFSYPNSRLYIMRGVGDGTFSIGSSYALGGTSVFLGDVNEDGILDVLVANSSTASVGILLGQAGGTFAPPYSVGVGWAPNSGVAADFNGDGHLDLLTAGFDSRVSLLLGFGDGTFMPPATWIGGVWPGPVLAGDFNGDGLTDGAAADQYPFSGGVTVFWSAQLTAVTITPAVSALVNGPASLTVQGGAPAAVSYQWRRSGIPLSDGGTISGARTATLTIDPAAFADAGSYDVLVTGSCTTVTSDATQLAVEFADVPVSNIFHADILTIATAGITAGCGGANYCPSALVNRAQMAVFLLKSEHGPAYVPPACAGLFADVPCPSTYANWIEQLSNEGVTAGCGNGDYCPDASITRAQMAVFLLKTSQGSAYVPPAATAIFDDVPVGAFADAFIDDLYTRGIAGGCSTSPLLYCPNNVVNRAQMAALLVNTFF